VKGRVMHQSGWFISRESDRESGRGSKAKSRKKVDLSSAATITRGFISDPIERLPSSQSTKEFIKARHLESIVSRTGSPSHSAHFSTMAAKANMGSMVRPPVQHPIRVLCSFPRQLMDDVSYLCGAIEVENALRRVIEMLPFCRRLWEQEPSHSGTIASSGSMFTPPPTVQTGKLKRVTRLPGTSCASTSLQCSNTNTSNINSNSSTVMATQNLGTGVPTRSAGHRVHQMGRVLSPRARLDIGTEGVQRQPGVRRSDLPLTECSRTMAVREDAFISRFRRRWKWRMRRGRARIRSRKRTCTCRRGMGD